jgi:hypothetical protein
MRLVLRNFFRCSEAGVQIVLASFRAELCLPHKKATAGMSLEQLKDKRLFKDTQCPFIMER